MQLKKKKIFYKDLCILRVLLNIHIIINALLLLFFETDLNTDFFYYVIWKYYTQVIKAKENVTENDCFKDSHIDALTIARRPAASV